MVFPNIDDLIPSLTTEETLNQLLDSLAHEEYSLSKLLEAESKKIEAFIGKDMNFPTNPTSKEIVEFNQTINKLLTILVMKEWLSLQKLERILEERVKKEIVGDKDEIYND